MVNNRYCNKVNKSAKINILRLSANGFLNSNHSELFQCQVAKHAFRSTNRKR